MQETPFIWLGANRAKKRGVGAKGIWLDKIAKGRLPVPNGGILLDQFYRLALEANLLVATPKAVITTNADELHAALFEDVRFPRLTKPVAVRAAFSHENGTHVSGEFRLNIDPTHPPNLIDALCDVYSSALAHTGKLRQDILIMNMVSTETTGIITSQQNNENDIMTIGTENHTIPQLKSWQTATTSLPPYAQRAQKLIRGVRRTLGRGDWQVEWADDGTICWVMQITAVNH